VALASSSTTPPPPPSPGCPVSAAPRISYPVSAGVHAGITRALILPCGACARYARTPWPCLAHTMAMPAHTMAMPRAHHGHALAHLALLALALLALAWHGLQGDPLGGCAVSAAGFAQMAHLLCGLANGRVVVALVCMYVTTSTPCTLPGWMSPRRQMITMCLDRAGRPRSSGLLLADIARRRLLRVMSYGCG
jgi:hypothetical protein